VDLLLKEWDKQRRILRKSRYAKLTSERKAKFLAALAYHLTYKVKTKVFSGNTLVEAYKAIYQRFGLPENEAEEVAEDLESHTGIVVKTGSSKYEFSHLSVQEFLCAEYIVKDRSSANVREYIEYYPAPIAVAVAISSDPSRWLEDLFLQKRSFRGYFTPNSFSVFLSRLLVERPYFEPSVLLGLALLKMFTDFDGTPGLREFGSAKSSLETLARSIPFYYAGSRSADKLVLTLRDINRNRSDLPAPSPAHIPIEIFERVIREAHGTLLCNFGGGNWQVSADAGLDRIITLPDTSAPQSNLDTITRELRRTADQSPKGKDGGDVQKALIRLDNVNPLRVNNTGQS
jgi:hypothetical protein